VTLGIVAGLLGPAVIAGPQASFFADLFGARVRYSGASLGFQLGAVLAGGLAPIVAAGVVAGSGSLMPVGLFMVGLGILTVGCVWAAAESRPRDSGDERVDRSRQPSDVVADGRIGTRAPGTLP
jgi:hypothetical protein